MVLLTTYEQWMNDTYSLIRPRSDELKRLDRAIMDRDERKVKAALSAWIDQQNQRHHDWHQSVRNEKGAVKKLYDELGGLGATPQMSMNDEIADKAAKMQVRRAQREAAARMFLGAELQFKDYFLRLCFNRAQAERNKIEQAKNTLGKQAKTGIEIAKDIQGVYSQASQIKQDLNNVIDVIFGRLPAGTKEEVIKQVCGFTLPEFIASATPALGIVTAGAAAIKDWIGVARNLSGSIDLMKRHVDIRLGDPTAALDAMLLVIDRQIEKQTRDAAIRTTSFSAKTAGILADVGTISNAAVGVLESVALILNMLADVAADKEEMDNGNRLIRERRIDLDLFNSCPILGCYYIAIQDHSTIMNFEIANMGRENWKREALRLRYAIEPVLARANQLIQQSRVELRGMEQAKGVYQSSVLDKVKMMYKESGYGLSAKMGGIGSDRYNIVESVVRGQI